jgi:predicted ATPase
MLKNIFFENFKAWQQLDLSLGQVTGIFGTNSSGKSSLIQMLLMLKQTKNNSDRSIALDFGNQDKLTDLGSYQDVVSRHDVTKDIAWKLHWSLAKELKITDIEKSTTSVLFNGSELALSSTVGLTDQLLETKQLRYEFDHSGFLIESKDETSSEMVLKVEGKAATNQFRFIRTQGRNWKLPKPLKNYLFPDQAKTYYQNADFLSQFEAEFESAMDNIYYLGPLRDHPKRSYQWTGTSPTDVGMRGEFTVNAILSATLKNEKRNLGKGQHYKSFQQMIAHWLKVLGLIDSFRVEELAPNANLYKTFVRKEAGAAEVGLTDVGFGVSQVLPVLVLLYYVPKGSTVLLEQPEIHLHPAVQSRLADLVLTVAKTRNIQVIVESHSEHFIRRLQRRVAEGSADNEVLKLYFFSTCGGKAQYEELKLDRYGAIHNWPENFFGDEMSEISATRKAALLKRKKQHNAEGKNGRISE